MKLNFFNLLLIGSILSLGIISSCSKESSSPTDDNSKNTNSNGTVTASIEVSSNYIDAGDEIKFTAKSSNANEWQWAFGDGGTSFLENPTYVYNEEGEYEVSLKVSNSSDSDTDTKTIHVDTNPNLPQPNWWLSKTDYVCNVSETYKFTITSGGTSSVHWDFGDGTSSTATSPTHTFYNNAAYKIILSVTNSYGTGTKSHTIQFSIDCTEI